MLVTLVFTSFSFAWLIFNKNFRRTTVRRQYKICDMNLVRSNCSFTRKSTYTSIADCEMLYKKSNKITKYTFYTFISRLAIRTCLSLIIIDYHHRMDSIDLITTSSLRYKILARYFRSTLCKNVPCYSPEEPNRAKCCFIIYLRRERRFETHDQARIEFAHYVEIAHFLTWYYFALDASDRRILPTEVEVREGEDVQVHLVKVLKNETTCYARTPLLVNCNLKLDDSENNTSCDERIHYWPVNGACGFYITGVQKQDHGLWRLTSQNDEGEKVVDVVTITVLGTAWRTNIFQYSWKIAINVKVAREMNNNM